MRKFTKEITALLASVAMGACACAGAASVSSEEPEPLLGDAAISDESIEDTPTAGVPMPPDDLTEPEPVPTEEYPPLIGEPLPPDDMIEDPTEEFPPVDGGLMPPDETVAPTEEYPPIAGETMPPDEPTEYTTEEDFPPLMGIVAPPDGDVSGDGTLDILDVVMFQKWMLGVPGAELVNREAADIYTDGRLDVFDLALIKRRLVEKKAPDFIPPDFEAVYHTPLHVTADSLTLYYGPGEFYKKLDTVPQGTSLYEHGYQKNDDIWMFTEYNGQYGWIRTREDDGKPTVEFEVEADKPVIYLYPEQETDVHVELELTASTLATTYPRYQNGWDVTAYPDGTLLNKADGTHHRYLFWDSTDCRMRYDLSKGFCVAGCDTEAFLKEKLTYMGLTEEERNEFIVYWLPRMEHNAFNLITFQGDAYTDAARLHITPEPDSICRIFMVYVPLEQAVETEPQTLPVFERKGFAVVEWGGSELRG